MIISTKKPAAKLLAATAAAVGLVFTMGSGNASAGPLGVTFSVTAMQSDGSRSMTIHRNGNVVGKAFWRANGDTLGATDSYADGFGIGSYLSTSPVREADTFGHNSPYTRTVGGNLPEDKPYWWWACIGSTSAGLTCSDMYKVTS